MGKTLTPVSGDRTGRSGKRPQKRGVQRPEIFVKVQHEGWPYREYSKARIRVRKGCYQYLIWSDAGKKHEFYLGQKKELPPSGAGELAPARSRAGGKK